MPPLPRDGAPASAVRPHLPEVLVSYLNVDKFLSSVSPSNVRSWVLDSGAFSAYNAGAEVDLHAFTDRCLELLASAWPPRVVFALDVIGDPEASLRNTDYMVKCGVPAVPCFHLFESWHYLDDMGKRFSKVALGGGANRGANGHGGSDSFPKRRKWVEGCFARLWPKWVHGFGCCDRRLLFAFPFASADSTTWYYGPARYGALQFGHRNNDGRISKVVPKRADNPVAFAAAVRVQVDWHFDLEEEVRRRFGRVLGRSSVGEFTLSLGVSGGDECSYLKGTDAATT